MSELTAIADAIFNAPLALQLVLGLILGAIAAYFSFSPGTYR